jgi:MFS family permease
MNAPGELPRRPPSGGLLRRAPAFRGLWLARAVSYTGDGISQVAIVVFASASGPAAVGLALLANTAPRLLGPLAGALADRVERRRLMTTCQLAQGLVMAVLAALPPALSTLLAFSAAAGLLATVFGPAARSATPRLVDHQDLGRANAMLGTALNLQVILGPALGGLLVAHGGPRTAFAVDALSFAVSPPIAAASGRPGCSPTPAPAWRTSPGPQARARWSSVCCCWCPSPPSTTSRWSSSSATRSAETSATTAPSRPPTGSACWPPRSR